MVCVNKKKTQNSHKYRLYRVLLKDVNDANNRWQSRLRLAIHPATCYGRESDQDTITAGPEVCDATGHHYLTLSSLVVEEATKCRARKVCKFCYKSVSNEKGCNVVRNMTQLAKLSRKTIFL
ncbi:hypothetical protein J6590_031325 [Homalodisca vitripennis]|nr:hypothetical protein J6590_031325 [Homalodisca vitripennis]